MASEGLMKDYRTSKLKSGVVISGGGNPPRCHLTISTYQGTAAVQKAALCTHYILPLNLASQVLILVPVYL